MGQPVAGRDDHRGGRIAFALALSWPVARAGCHDFEESVEDGRVGFLGEHLNGQRPYVIVLLLIADAGVAPALQALPRFHPLPQAAPFQSRARRRQALSQVPLFPLLSIQRQ